MLQLKLVNMTEEKNTEQDNTVTPHGAKVILELKKLFLNKGHRLFCADIYFYFVRNADLLDREGI